MFSAFFSDFLLKFSCWRAVKSYVSITLVQIKIKYIPMCAAGLISTAECSRKIGITDRSVRRLKARFNACAFYALYILFSVTKFRNVTKKRKMLLKHHDNVIYYIKTVYFFIHVKNENIAFPFFLLFRFFSFLFVICELRFYLVKKL